MRAIEENRGHGFGRVGLFLPVPDIGSFDVVEINAVFGGQVRIAIAVSGEQQTVGEEFQTLDEIAGASAHQVTGDRLQNIGRDVALLRHLRVEFSGAAHEEKLLAAFATTLLQKFESGNRFDSSVNAEQDDTGFGNATVEGG